MTTNIFMKLSDIYDIAFYATSYRLLAISYSSKKARTSQKRSITDV